MSAERSAGWPFSNNHREVIAAFDFFTFPSLTFRTLYCFFVIEHGRRRILHFNVTEHPTSDRIVQQLREALPLPCPYPLHPDILFDLDTKFGGGLGYTVGRLLRLLQRAINLDTALRVSFTSSAVGNWLETSGAKTTTLVPAANRAACLPRTPLLKSYSGRRLLEVCAFVLTCFFILLSLISSCESRADEADSVGSLCVRYHEQAPAV